MYRFCDYGTHVLKMICPCNKDVVNTYTFYWLLYDLIFCIRTNEISDDDLFAVLVAKETVKCFNYKVSNGYNLFMFIYLPT